MTWEEISAFREEMQTSTKARELFRSMEQPRNEEEKLAAIVSVAQELGYDLTAEDFKAYEEARKEKTDEQAEKIRLLNEEDLESVAGGKWYCAGNFEHEPCKYSYKDYENCWVKDGCDAVYQHYQWYRCHYNDYEDCTKMW